VLVILKNYNDARNNECKKKKSRKKLEETNFSGNADARLLGLGVMTALASLNVNLWLPKPPNSCMYSDLKWRMHGIKYHIWHNCTDTNGKTADV